MELGCGTALGGSLFLAPGSRRCFAGGIRDPRRQEDGKMIMPYRGIAFFVNLGSVRLEVGVQGMELGVPGAVMDNM